MWNYGKSQHTPTNHLNFRIKTYSMLYRNQSLIVPTAYCIHIFTHMHLIIIILHIAYTFPYACPFVLFSSHFFRQTPVFVVCPSVSLISVSAHQCLEADWSSICSVQHINVNLSGLFHTRCLSPGSFEAQMNNGIGPKGQTCSSPMSNYTFISFWMPFDLNEHKTYFWSDFISAGFEMSFVYSVAPKRSTWKYVSHHKIVPPITKPRSTINRLDYTCGVVS